MATVAITTDQYLDDYEGTASDSFTIGTSGSQSITADTGKAWYVGMTIELHRAADNAVFQYGTITAYDSGTGAMTFTKNSGGSGSGTYSDWVISYRRADTLAVSNNATLTMRQGNVTQIRTIAATIKGTLRIKPTDRTKPTVLMLESTSSRLQFEQNGVLLVNDDINVDDGMIDFYTGDGTAGQTIISGATVLGVSVGYPTYVEVDDGINKFPWKIYPINYSGGTAVYSTSDIGANDVGNVLFWNHSTGTLTCGDGTNGNIIPNGATVRFPCVVIDCLVNNAAYASRAQIDVNPSGTLNIKCVNFTEKIYCNANNYLTAEAHKIGVVARLVCSSSSGALTLGDYSNNDYVISNPDPYGATIGIVISNVSGRVKASGLIGVGVLSQGVQFNTTPNADIHHIEGTVMNRTSTAAYGVNLVNVTNLDDDGNPKNIENITCIGGVFYNSNQIGQVVNGYKHSDQSSGVIASAVNLDVINFTNCKDCVIYNVTKASGGASQRNYFVTFDAQTSNCKVHTFSYDASDNGNAVSSPAGGPNCDVCNGTYTQRSGTSLITASGAGSGAIRNIDGAYAYSAISVITKGQVDLCVGANMSTVCPNYPDGGPFFNLRDAGPGATTGILNAGAFGIESEHDIYEVTGSPSSVYWNNNGGIYIGTTGDVVVIKSYEPIHAITSFQNATPTLRGFATSGLTVEFRVANAGLGDWTSWATADGTNLSAALGTLTDYDELVGFDMQMRVTATTDDATRYLTNITMTTNINPAYTAVVGTTKVGVSGAQVGTRIAVFDATNTLIGQTVLTSDTGFVRCPYAFDGSTASGFIRVRCPGYAPIVLPVTWRSSDTIIPVTQVENKDIQGVPIYGRGTGATTSLFDFNLADLRIDIGNGKGIGEDLYDAVCEYQATSIGIQAPEILTFDGRDILMDPLSGGWRFRRWHTTDTNAALDCLPILASDPNESPDDEVNGSIDFSARAVRTLFSANDTQAIAQAVRAEMDANSVKLKKALTLGQFIGLK